MLVYFQIEDDYNEDFMEQIKQLKENHIFMKDHERTYSKRIK